MSSAIRAFDQSAKQLFSPVIRTKRTKLADFRRRALLKDGQVVTVNTNRGGGGGDRTRISSDAITLSSIDLRQRIQILAAQWLQSPDIDEHELARIVTIAEYWLTLTETQKSEIELVVGAGQRNAN